jgi:hypothetical protein
MERRLFAVCNSGARVLIVRAGDFFGLQVGNNWLGREPHTPLDEAVEATLMGLRCIATPDGPLAARLGGHRAASNS